jgi:serine/threonine protein phosphatase PrpC
MNQKPVFKWSSAGRSHVGMVRAINEDACLVMPELGLWTVADGMGGHEAGDIASQMIDRRPCNRYGPPSDWEGFLNSVRQAVAGGESAIAARSRPSVTSTAPSAARSRSYADP